MQQNKKRREKEEEDLQNQHSTCDMCRPTTKEYGDRENRFDLLHAKNKKKSKMTCKMGFDLLRKKKNKRKNEMV